MPRYIMAHDLGTSGHKCSVFDETGHAVAWASLAYPTYYGEGGEAEQHPDDWWDAVVRSTRLVLDRVRPSDIAAVGFSAHMMAVCPADRCGRPLGRALIHADTRSAPLAGEAFRLLDADRLYERTGNRLDSRYPLLKLMWLKRRRPDAYREAAYFLQPKDYLAGRMSGTFGVTDYSDASLTGLFDIHGCRWDDGIAEAFGIDRAKLPDIVPSATLVGGVTAEAAAETGLAPGTPVALGGGDGSCAALGAGAIAPGEAYVYIGTTAWVSRAAAAPAADEKKRIFTMCGPEAGLYYGIGTMQAAGAAHQWAARELGSRGAPQEDPYVRLEEEIGRLPWGSNGLVFHPYLQGERSPVWNEEARGLFFGLESGHTRFHMARAVMEGVGYGLRSIAEALRGTEPAACYAAIGGGMKSPAWREIVASALDAPIRVPAQTEAATSLGAAMAAGVAVGMFADYADARRRFARETAEIAPKADRGRVLEGYRLYVELYERLRDLYPRLRTLRGY
ncbi:xylulokinase [Cohnella algarum]|uniref:xylulokinase n=1 Tax=Cohnella algarum TaxID=2044859 RepID=UPI001967E45A|nr:FGGY family carbohydrate kinase [Cohnella algarum]MBN2983635.1 hypothetical protein [Cohnella algarum]